MVVLKRALYELHGEKIIVVQRHSHALSNPAPGAGKSSPAASALGPPSPPAPVAMQRALPAGT